MADTVCADVYNEPIETLLTAMLDDAGVRLPGARRIDLTQGAERMDLKSPKRC